MAWVALDGHEIVLNKMNDLGHDCYFKLKELFLNEVVNKIQKRIDRTVSHELWLIAYYDTRVVIDSVFSRNSQTLSKPLDEQNESDDE